MWYFILQYTTYTTLDYTTLHYTHTSPNTHYATLHADTLSRIRDAVSDENPKSAGDCVRFARYTLISLNNCISNLSDYLAD